MSDLSKFKNIKELANACQMTEKEIWAIMTGKNVKTVSQAVLVSSCTGVSVSSLLLSNISPNRFRPWFLSWISYRSGLSKTELWRTFTKKTSMRKKKARAMAKWSGIPQEEWRNGTAWMLDIKSETE